MNTIDSTSSFSYGSYMPPAAAPPSPSDASGDQPQSPSFSLGSTAAPPASTPASVVDAAQLPADAGDGTDADSGPNQSQTDPRPHQGSPAGTRDAGKNSPDHPLKTAGVKTEIQIEQGVGVVVQLVQAATNKVVMQSPPQGVIDMVAEIQQAQDKAMGIAPEAGCAAASPTPPAGAPLPASGTYIDQLA